MLKMKTNLIFLATFLQFRGVHQADKLGCYHIRVFLFAGNSNNLNSVEHQLHQVAASYFCLIANRMEGFGHNKTLAFSGEILAWQCLGVLGQIWIDQISSLRKQMWMEKEFSCSHTVPASQAYRISVIRTGISWWHQMQTWRSEWYDFLAKTTDILWNWSNLSGIGCIARIQ